MWVSDFTRIVWHEKILYLATVLDLFDAGGSWAGAYRIGMRSPWSSGPSLSALLHRPRPTIFRSVGELAAEVHARICAYNTSRIHSALRMALRVFRERYENRFPVREPELVEKVSNVWGS